ncbi:hypothetical protein [Nocardioides sp.]|uniref:hypothetical protein n=1 Tax=Nocardioides sp. TaxID=35761 RepID=UPI001A1BDED4|nr:hypothetical protein [Nocardioides sp.]MBJ7356120.1 hypothetical protein [Nocardioides sp.]
MSSALKRVHSATGTVALVLALLALLASAAGVGYAAGQIGTSDIKNNAITAPKIKKNAVTTKKIKKNAVAGKKIKDGSVTPADLAPQEAQRKPVLGNGGEGDCVWQSGEVEVPGVGAPTYRLDRNGRVILTGIVVATDGPGGDGSCDPGDAGQASDGIAFTLPAGYIPAKNQFFLSVGGEMIITGPQGFNAPGFSLPAGVVFADDAAILDGIEFDPAGSSVVVAKTKASGRWTGTALKPSMGG